MLPGPVLITISSPLLFTAEWTDGHFLFQGCQAFLIP